MKLATLRNGTRDGRLVIVSTDLQWAVDATPVVPTLQQALEQWDDVATDLQRLASALQAGEASGAFRFEPQQAMAPLPRSHQFVDASAFVNHGDIMERAYQLTVKKTPGVPILIQRQGDGFAGPCDDYPVLNEAEQIDYEGEFAVILGDVPMASGPEACLRAIRLVTLINDVSMRKHVGREMGMGFGFINAKTATAFAPVAVTPDELGVAWRDGRVHLALNVRRNGALQGQPHGGEMDWGFHELVAHLAYNRRLQAGTIVGSGTVSNRDADRVGSACLAEVRAREVIAHGAPRTPFLALGERMAFDACDAQGRSVFGAIDHRFVQHRPSGPPG